MANQECRSEADSLSSQVVWQLEVSTNWKPFTTQNSFRAWLLCKAKASDHFGCFKCFSICHCYQSMSKLDFKSSCSRHERKWKQQTRAQLVCKETCITLKLFCSLYKLRSVLFISKMLPYNRGEQYPCLKHDPLMYQKSRNANQDLSFPVGATTRFCQRRDK